jgi:hypothetical protein
MFGALANSIAPMLSSKTLHLTVVSTALSGMPNEMSSSSNCITKVMSHRVALRAMYSALVVERAMTLFHYIYMWNLVRITVLD